MIRSLVPESVARFVELVDDVVDVTDAALLDAMTLAAGTIGVLLEPAGDGPDRSEPALESPAIVRARSAESPHDTGAAA